ncbi:MAG: aldo/keto reductase [Clostridia bacterium]|nr:aldo/keto reductase [Clostridia bacterium]
MVKNEFYTLYNGVTIPKIGFGTWQVAEGEEAYNSVTYALKVGYRHIDTAHAYGNEASVGRAIADSGIDRKDIFVTTKLPSLIKDYQGTMQHFNQSLTSLGLEYIDLYLIHAPWPWSDIGTDCTQGNIQAWKAMIELYNAGKIRSIGVSNFHPADMQALIDATGVVPMVNQIRYFIGNTQPAIVDYCNQHNILIQAYSPLATGEIVNNEQLQPLAQKYGVTVAKICLRYCLQKGTLPLPKSTNEGRIAQNLELDFTIDQDDMTFLDNIGRIGKIKPYRS